MLYEQRAPNMNFPSVGTLKRLKLYELRSQLYINMRIAHLASYWTGCSAEFQDGWPKTASVAYTGEYLLSEGCAINAAVLP